MSKSKMTDREFQTAALALRRAKKKIGVSGIAGELGITPQAVGAWTVCPANHVTEVADLSDEKESDLRPDVFGRRS